MNFDQVLDKAKQYTQHDMIQTYVDLPNLSSQRTYLLYTLLKQGKQLSDNELFALVTMLVQLGMDIHDNIPNHSGKHAVMDRTKQLNVLAGDYFSGRFYQLLAQVGQVEIINKLSRSICDVNKAKVNLYDKMKKLKCSAEDYLKQMESIKTGLFLAFSQWFDPSERSVWSDFLSTFTRCEILKEEIGRIENEQRFQYSWAYWYLLEQASEEDKLQMTNSSKLETYYVPVLLMKYQVKDRMKELLSRNVHFLQSIVKQYAEGYFAIELRKLIEPLLIGTTPVNAAEESS